MIRRFKHILRKRRHAKWKRDNRARLVLIYPMTPAGQLRRQATAELKQWALEDTRSMIVKALEKTMPDLNHIKISNG